MPLHSIAQKLPAVIYAKADTINPTQSLTREQPKLYPIRTENKKTKRLANMQGIEGVASIARPRYA